MRQFAGRALSAIAKAIEAREAILIVGLGLVSYGLWQVWMPAAFIVPGTVLLYVSIFGTR